MKRLVSVLVLVTFLFTSGFGFLHALSMGVPVATGMQGMHMETIDPCPFMNEVNVGCDMSILEHIGAWQHTFTTTIGGGSLLSLLVFVFAILLSRSFAARFPTLFAVSHSRKRLRLHVPTLYTVLFAQGLLNPKLH